MLDLNLARRKWRLAWVVEAGYTPLIWRGNILNFKKGWDSEVQNIETSLTRKREDKDKANGWLIALIKCLVWVRKKTHFRKKFPQVIGWAKNLRKSVGGFSQEYWTLKNGMIATLQYLISNKKVNPATKRIYNQYGIFSRYFTVKIPPSFNGAKRPFFDGISSTRYTVFWWSFNRESLKCFDLRIILIRN